MRFAITAFDMYQGVFESFLRAGWEPVKLFSFPISHPSRNSSIRGVTARAHQLKIPIQLSRMTEADFRDLQQRGCDALIGAGYIWRIGDWRPYLPYAINFHPSPLPEGRGCYPAVRAILERDRRTQWGVSCHKFDQEFDTGDILAQEMFPLAERDCHETLTLKTQVALRRLADRVANDLPTLWRDASPQAAGDYWPKPADADRVLNFSQSVDAILRQVDAFGTHETIARIGKAVVYVRRAVGWTECHSHAAGKLIDTGGRRLLIAAPDGYIGLIEWSMVDPASRAETGS